MTVIAFHKRLTAPDAVPQPDPRNGEVYACEFSQTSYVDGREIETPSGFMWVHMSRSGDSASMERGFETLQEAEDAAERRATLFGAIYVCSTSKVRT
jgi:hypothetical protein